MSVKNVDDILWWDLRDFSEWRSVPFEKKEHSADFLLGKRLDFTFSVMKSFEGIPLTLPETKDILQGKYPEKIQVRDYLRVRAFAQNVSLVSVALKSVNGCFPGVVLHLLQNDYAGTRTGFGPRP